jgi:hypothetical protein
MTLMELLNERADEILAGAMFITERSHLAHYETAGADRLWQRLTMLYETLYRCIRDNNGVPMIEYVEELARERFTSGFELAEVQTAFSALEESTWISVDQGLPAEERSRALARISSVLAMGRDVLARRYVALTREAGTTSLDVERLHMA